jgi:hypothetical protein
MCLVLSELGVLGLFAFDLAMILPGKLFPQKIQNVKVDDN